MTGQRIDHAATAIANLSALLEGEPVKAADAVVVATIAQAHATLALVEQQRIANIIALVAVPAVHAESLDRYPGVKDQVLEALGLS